MLLVGAPELRFHGDRWGAVWWYDFLVAQMERAGPTFTKASPFTKVFPATHKTAECLVSAMGSLTC